MAREGPDAVGGERERERKNKARKLAWEESIS
jgi:hypothetical protein